MNKKDPNLIFYVVISTFSYQRKGTMNFALHKSAVQSTTLNYGNFLWTADKAVDGKIDGSNPEQSMSCSATHVALGVNHTWEVDIGFNITVQTITVYGRTDENKGDDQLSGFNLYLGNNSRSWTYNQPLVVISSANKIHVFKPNNTVARFIALVRQTHILTICEVIVDGECNDGLFSEFTQFCNNTCGKCVHSQPCNKMDGMCPNGCDPGWKGTHCNKECDTGKYGLGCNETCGNCLVGNADCSTVDGNCTGGCKAGYQGDGCKKVCDTGKYSYNCNETCGNDLRACRSGTYGSGCNETCGNCYKGNDSCSLTDGICMDGCEAGWHGGICKISTLGTVTPVDGGPNAGVIVGSVLAAVGVSIFSMVIYIVIVKNRRKKDNNETSSGNMTTATHYANLVVVNPDAACNANVHSTNEKETTLSAFEEACLQKGMPIGVANSHNGVKEPDIPVHNNYEKLRDVTESTESAYSTMDHSLIYGKKMESMENCSNYVETLQSLESALKSVEEEISVLLDRKEKLLCKELERARANKLQEKKKQNDSTQFYTDKDYTNVNDLSRDDLERYGNYVKMLQSLEGELRILEEKRKCILGKKEILLR